MKLNQILLLDEFSFPIQRNQYKPFKEFIENLLDSFVSSLTQVPSNQLFDGISFSFYNYSDSNSFLKAVDDVIIEIKSCLQLFFDGKSALAYYQFNSLLTTYGLVPLFSQTNYAYDTSFYRMRYLKNNYSIEKEELFHMPFDKIEKISNQRFSITGQPALYMANSLYTCWEELNRPDIQNIQSATLRNRTDIKIISLDWKEFYIKLINKNYTSGDILNYTLVWPLLACCNVKVPSIFNNDAFKGEYIFPQLFMQYVINNSSSIEGIRYSSTKTSYGFENVNDKFYNIVMPVKQVLYKGHCSLLKSIFKISYIENWNLQNFINLKSRIISGQNRVYQNSDVSKVCITNNVFIEYQDTIFFEIESYFNSISFKDLLDI